LSSTSTSDSLLLGSHDTHRRHLYNSGTVLLSLCGSHALVSSGAVVSFSWGSQFLPEQHVLREYLILVCWVFVFVSIPLVYGVRRMAEVNTQSGKRYKACVGVMVVLVGILYTAMHTVLNALTGQASAVNVLLLWTLSEFVFLLGAIPATICMSKCTLLCTRHRRICRFLSGLGWWTWRCVVAGLWPAGLVLVGPNITDFLVPVGYQVLSRPSGHLSYEWVYVPTVVALMLLSFRYARLATKGRRQQTLLSPIESESNLYYLQETLVPCRETGVQLTDIQLERNNQPSLTVDENQLTGKSPVVCAEKTQIENISSHKNELDMNCEEPLVNSTSDGPTLVSIAAVVSTPGATMLTFLMVSISFIWMRVLEGFALESGSLPIGTRT
jgi:hypothetical protein